MSADVSEDKSVGVSVDVSVGVSVGVAEGTFVDIAVGDRGLPWYAVGAAVEIAVEIAVDLAVEIVVEMPWLVPRASTILRYLPRHSVDARVGCAYKPVEGPRLPVECPRLSVKRHGHGRGMPWRSMDTTALLRQKDK